MTDRDWMLEACAAARQSPDLSTQNGAVLVSCGREIGRGCNRPPEPLEVTPARLQRPLKYVVTEHAERAALFAVVGAGRGDLVPGSTLYGVWVACPDCARAILGCGVRRVVGHHGLVDRAYGHAHADWARGVQAGLAILIEGGVALEWLDGPLGAAPLRFDGQEWTP